MGVPNVTAMSHNLIHVTGTWCVLSTAGPSQIIVDVPNATAVNPRLQDVQKWEIVPTHVGRIEMKEDVHIVAILNPLPPAVHMKVRVPDLVGH